MLHNKEKAAPVRTANRNKQSDNNNNHLNFKKINRAALPVFPALLMRWLPDGKKIGYEWVALNPRRADHHAGSFKVNMRTGRWADFATGDRGGDIISLAAYIGQIKQCEAARQLSLMLGVCHD